MNIAKHTSFFFLMLGLMSFEAKAELNLDGIVDTASQECEDLGNDAVSIQSIRFQEHSSINDIMRTVTLMVEEELGTQPIFISRVNAVAKWVFYHYPEDFSPDLVGQTYTVECMTKIDNQLKLLLDEDEYTGLGGMQKI